jgi:hypothetical protein
MTLKVLLNSYWSRMSVFLFGQYSKECISAEALQTLQCCKNNGLMLSWMIC